MSDGNCDELFEDLYSVIGTYRPEFGLSGLKIKDLGRNGKDLVLILVNFLRFLL